MRVGSKQAGAFRQAVGLGAMTLMLIAPVALWGSPTAPAGATVANTVVPVPGAIFSSDAIACPSPTVCLAGGSSSTTDGGQIVVINGSNGAAALGGTDSAMIGVGGIACPTDNQCVAVSGSNAVSVNGANGGTGPDNSESAPPYSGMNSVACPVATDCLAAGYHLVSYPTFKATLNTVSPSGVPGPTVTGRMGQGTSIACVSASRCYAGVAGDGSGALEVIDNGAVSKSFTLPFGAFALACYQAAACIVAGEVGGSPPTDYVAELNPTTGKPGAAQPISGMYEVQGAGCASATECFVLGYNVSNSTLSGAIAGVENGQLQTTKTGPGQADYGMACSTATTCWGIGQKEVGTRLEGIVFSVHVPGG